MIALAQADNFTTAKISGVATHLIDVDQEGVITTFGKVGGVDTSSFAVGDTLFLSETVAGGYTTTPPDIASTVGGALFIDAAEGTLFVHIANLVALPDVIGYMSGATLPATISITPLDVNGYTGSGSIVIEVDPATGTITVPSTGIYRMTYTLACEFDADGAKRDLILEVFDDTDAAVIIDVPEKVIKDITSASFAASIPFNATAFHDYKLRVRAPDADFETVVTSLCAFDIQSVSIR